MISIIYQFDLKPKQEDDFIQAWHEMTLLIYKFENSLGSRLHKKDDRTFIAYALWPDQFTWENSGDKLPKEAQLVRQRMRQCCENVKVLFEMEVIDDLLKSP